LGKETLEHVEELEIYTGDQSNCSYTLFHRYISLSPLSKFIDLSLTDQIRLYTSLLKPLHGCKTQGNVKDT